MGSSNGGVRRESPEMTGKQTGENEKRLFRPSFCCQGGPPGQAEPPHPKEGGMPETADQNPMKEGRVEFQEMSAFEVLQALVERFGFHAVQAALREIEEAKLEQE